jgi:hypothetical protein
MTDPSERRLEVQQAADLLKVSRPYLLNLAKNIVGAHHRIPIDLVIAYKRKDEPHRQRFCVPKDRTSTTEFEASPRVEPAVLDPCGLEVG